MRLLLPTAVALSALVSCTKGDSGLDTGEDALVTYSDKDNDTIIDLHEGYLPTGGRTEAGEPEYETVDTDGDTKPDHMDPDSDDDGISDAREEIYWIQRVPTNTDEYRQARRNRPVFVKMFETFQQEQAAGANERQ